MFPPRLCSQHRRSQTSQPLNLPVNARIYKHTPAGARPSGRELQQAYLWDPREGKGQGTQTGLTSLPPPRSQFGWTPLIHRRWLSLSINDRPDFWDLFLTWVDPLIPEGLLQLTNKLSRCCFGPFRAKDKRVRKGFCQKPGLRLSCGLLISSSEKTLSSVTRPQAGVQ